MKNGIICCLLFLGLVTTASAQKEETLFNDARLNLTGFWGSANHQFDYLEDDYTNVRGGYGLFEFNQKVLIGWGNSRFREFSPTNDSDDAFRLRYGGLVLGYAPAAHKVIHPTFMVMLGQGRASTRDNENDRNLVAVPTAGLEINVTRWFRLSANVGYRYVSENDLRGYTNQELSAPFAQVGLKFGYSWGK